MSRFFGKLAPTLLVASLAGTAALVIPAAEASASTLNGVATIATPGTSNYLASGGSETQFTVSLPTGAACDGDTSSDGYHVYSYLVPEGTNLSTVTFGESGPSVGYGIVDQNGIYYGAVNTAVGTGQIVQIPNDFEWGPLQSQDGLGSQLLAAPGGIWETGLACANSRGTLTDNWNSQITFTASAADPNGFVWSAVPGPSGSAVPAITSAATTNFAVGASDTFTVKSTGSPTPVLSESGTLPTGVTFTAATGVLAGTPTAAGSYPLTFTATNGIGNPAVQHFTLDVVAAALTIKPGTLTKATVGTAYKVTFTATGGKAPYKWSKSKGTLPAGLALSSAGVLKGTPTTAGTYNFTVKVKDSATTPLSATKAYKLVVAS